MVTYIYIYIFNIHSESIAHEVEGRMGFASEAMRARGITRTRTITGNHKIVSAEQNFELSRAKMDDVFIFIIILNVDENAKRNVT